MHLRLPYSQSAVLLLRKTLFYPWLIFMAHRPVFLEVSGLGLGSGVSPEGMC